MAVAGGSLWKSPSDDEHPNGLAGQVRNTGDFVPSPLSTPVELVRAQREARSDVHWPSDDWF